MTEIQHRELAPVIDAMRAKIKSHPTIKRIFKDYGADLEEIDLIPICFAELDVSARTEKGIIYLNIHLLDDGNVLDDVHYLVHEITHYLQQCCSDGPTKGSTDDNYLYNNEEVEGFQNQVEYIADTHTPETAEKYVDQVLDHHGLKAKEREDRKQKLLELAED